MTKRGSKKRKGSRSKRMYGGLDDAVQEAIPQQTVNAEHVKKAEEEEEEIATSDTQIPLEQLDADIKPNTKDVINAVEIAEAETAKLQKNAASPPVSAPAAASGAVKKDLTEVNSFKTFWNEATGSISVVSDTAPDIKTYLENTEKTVSLADAAATPVAATPVGTLGGRRSRKIKRSRRKGSRRNRRR